MKGDTISRNAILNNSMLHTMKKKDVLDLIRNAPTVEPPVVHGRWIKGICNMYVCDQCGNASIAEKEERLDGYKFYYCASEDSYLLGYRVDNLYHARWHEPLGFVWEMSKYLPWGETISDESTDWKTHTYPSKPIEMGVNEWFNGFLNQRIKAALAAKEEQG